MRQVGILAAAGLYALQNNFERLKEDHQKAKMLGEVLNEINNIEIDLSAVQTNILIFKPLKISVEDAIEKCKNKGLLISVGRIDSIRAVTHLDVSSDDVETAIKIFKEVFV